MRKRVSQPRGRRPFWNYRERIDRLDQRGLRYVGVVATHVVDSVTENLILDVRMDAVDYELGADCVSTGVRAYVRDASMNSSAPDRGLHLAADPLPYRIRRPTRGPK